jgi:hypothetical protein
MAAKKKTPARSARSRTKGASRPAPRKTSAGPKPAPTKTGIVYSDPLREALARRLLAGR